MGVTASSPPLLPTACQVSSPVPPPQWLYPVPSSLSLGPWLRPVLFPGALIPAFSLASQPPVSHFGPAPQGPRADLPLPCSTLFHGSRASQGQSLGPGRGEGPAWPGPTCLPTPNHTCRSSDSELCAVPQARLPVPTSVCLGHPTCQSFLSQLTCPLLWETFLNICLWVSTLPWATDILAVSACIWNCWPPT